MDLKIFRLKSEMEVQRKKEYMAFEEIKDIQNLNCYTVVAVNDEIYVEKIL